MRGSQGHSPTMATGLVSNWLMRLQMKMPQMPEIPFARDTNKVELLFVNPKLFAISGTRFPNVCLIPSIVKLLKKQQKQTTPSVSSIHCPHGSDTLIKLVSNNICSPFCQAKITLQCHNVFYLWQWVTTDAMIYLPKSIEVNYVNVASVMG